MGKTQRSGKTQTRTIGRKPGNPLEKTIVPNGSTQNGAHATMQRGPTGGNPAPGRQPIPLLGDGEKHNISAVTVSYELGYNLNCINYTCV